MKCSKWATEHRQKSPAPPGAIPQCCLAQAGLFFPCQLRLIHRKQEAETGVLLKNIFCFPGSPWEGGRSRWELDYRVLHGALVKSLDSCWLGELSFLIRVFLIQIPHDTDPKSLSFHLAWLANDTSATRKSFCAQGPRSLAETTCNKHGATSKSPVQPLNIGCQQSNLG